MGRQHNNYAQLDFKHWPSESPWCREEYTLWPRLFQFTVWFPAAPSIVHIGKFLHHWHHSAGELQLISASPLGPDWEAAFFATHADLLVLCRWRVLLLASILPGYVWRQSQKSENSLKVTTGVKVYVLEEWITFESAILVFVYAWCLCERECLF